MDDELRELYRETIVDHSRRPRNFGPLADANRRAEGFNPLCGDRLTLELKLAGGVIEAARFEGAGCAISTAAASLMTEAVKGKSEAEAEALGERFRALLTDTNEPAAAMPGKLAALAGVRAFPARIKCALLAWHTLRAALHGEAVPASTE
jgi:nitrogen fixation NifU-like protein